MHPALQYDLMQARQHDLLQSAARQRVAGASQDSSLAVP